MRSRLPLTADMPQRKVSAPTRTAKRSKESGASCTGESLRWNKQGKMVMAGKAKNTILDVKLTVNGKKVDLNDFVKGIISQTIIGMVKSLRGVGDSTTIDLKISKKRIIRNTTASRK